MRFILKIIFVFAFVFGIANQCGAQKKTGQPIDVVFCLDLSSSSNGLIEQFRNHLWDYWNYFSKCRPQPDYRIAVVAYARFSYGKETGYSKVIKDLGTDFEKLSNLLFKIPSRIEKGDQYVGAALNTCIDKISWSKDSSAKKIIFLVGNGDVNLGNYNIDEIVGRAVSKNIIINTIYINAPGERQAIIGWEKIAQNGGGKISTMSLRDIYFDKLNGFDIQRFRALNRMFNNTYLYYGKGGRTRWNMLKSEDNNIYVSNTEGYRFRSLYKISDDYQKKNSTWDMVDLYYRNPVGFMNVDRQYLSDTCRKMDNSQLKSYIIYKKYERRKLSEMITEMISKKEIKDMHDGISSIHKLQTLDVITLHIIRDILKEKNCECVYN